MHTRRHECAAAAQGASNYLKHDAVSSWTIVAPPAAVSAVPPAVRATVLSAVAATATAAANGRSSPQSAESDALGRESPVPGLVPGLVLRLPALRPSASASRAPGRFSHSHSHSHSLADREGGARIVVRGAHRARPSLHNLQNFAPSPSVRKGTLRRAGGAVAAAGGLAAPVTRRHRHRHTDSDFCADPPTTDTDTDTATATLAPPSASAARRESRVRYDEIAREVFGDRGDGDGDGEMAAARSEGVSLSLLSLGDTVTADESGFEALQAQLSGMVRCAVLFRFRYAAT